MLYVLYKGAPFSCPSEVVRLECNECLGSLVLYLGAPFCCPSEVVRLRCLVFLGSLVLYMGAPFWCPSKVVRRVPCVSWVPCVIQGGAIFSLGGGET